MELLLDLPYKYLHDLIIRCETFDGILRTEQDLEDDKEILYDKEELIKSSSFYTLQIRKYVDRSSILEYSIIAIIILMVSLTFYFITVFKLDYDYRYNYDKLLIEVTSLMRLEARLQMGFNYHMECVYTKFDEEFNQKSLCLSLSATFIRTYELMRMIEEMETTNTFFDNYASDELLEIYQGDLCNNRYNIISNVIIGECANTAEGSVTHGLKVTMLYFVKLLYELVHKDTSHTDVICGEK